MVDDRFSASAFSALGLDTEGARGLSEQLAAEIQVEVHEVVARKMVEIVERLNAMGHRLKLDEDEPSVVSYRDIRQEAPGAERHYLRVAVDTTLSAGYAHMKSAEEVLASLDDILKPLTDLKK